MLDELQKQKAVVFFNSQSNYSQSLKNEFTTALFGDGGEVVAEFDLSRPEFSAVSAIQQATDRGAEVLMLAPNAGTLDKALQVVQVNEGRLPLLGGDDVYTPETLQIGRMNAVGMVVAIPWHILGNPNAEFPKGASQLWGAEVNWRTAMAYDATEALIAAIAQNPGRMGVQQALSSPDFATEGAAATIRFLPSGDRNQAAQLVTIEEGDRTGFGYDFVPVP
jgi:branched-chain amino acid transport system substrate-binding protein